MIIPNDDDACAGECWIVDIMNDEEMMMVPQFISKGGCTLVVMKGGTVLNLYPWWGVDGNNFHGIRKRAGGKRNAQERSTQRKFIRITISPAITLPSSSNPTHTASSLTLPLPFFQSIRGCAKPSTPIIIIIVLYSTNRRCAPLTTYYHRK